MNVYQRIQTSFDMTLAIKAHFLKNKPTFNTELDEPLTATDMRMRENDVTLGIPKTSYGQSRSFVFETDKFCLAAFIGTRFSLR